MTRRRPGCDAVTDPRGLPGHEPAGPPRRPRQRAGEGLPHCGDASRSRCKRSVQTAPALLPSCSDFTEAVTRSEIPMETPFGPHVVKTSADPRVDGVSFDVRAGRYGLRAVTGGQTRPPDDQWDLPAGFGVHPAARIRRPRSRARPGGVSPRGTRPLPEDEGARAAAVLRGNQKPRSRRGSPAGGAMAAPVRALGGPGPQARGALQGQPAEDPDHRHLLHEPS